MNHAHPIVPCAGGIVFDATGRLLVVLRGRAPDAGLWSVPGGRCLPGESPAEACPREVAEETGLHVRVTRVAGAVERPGPQGVIYTITDFVCSVVGGRLIAGDDAAAARWVSAAELASLPLVPQLAQTLEEWHCLPRT